jgi:hypothetical protein
MGLLFVSGLLMVICPPKNCNSYVRFSTRIRLSYRQETGSSSLQLTTRQSRKKVPFLPMSRSSSCTTQEEEVTVFVKKEMTVKDWECGRSGMRSHTE